MSWLLFSQVIFSQEKDYAKDVYTYFYLSWPYVTYVTPANIYKMCTEEDFYKEDKRSNFYLNKNGYFYYDNSLMIPGSIPYVSFNTVTKDTKTDENIKRKGIYFHSYFKTKYSASSELVEKTKSGTVKYNAENLGKFAFETDDKYTSLYWNFETCPWAVSGYGIGEKINIKTEEYFSSIIILNGYVDVKRLDLYKKNSRCKKIKVLDHTNNEEYIFNLEDVVEFQDFEFRNKTKDIEIIILEVYSGEKYKDLCISGIVPGSVGYNFERDDVPYEQKYSYKKDKNSMEEIITNMKENYQKWKETDTGK